MAARAALYSSVGDELTHYDIDADNGVLKRRDTTLLPANVQYVWPHPTKRFLYVASSPRGPGGKPGSGHHLSAFRVDENGTLSLHGERRALTHRPVHMSLDRSGSYALTAYNEPSAISVHRINEDGTLDAALHQPDDLDTGIFAHQVLATPSNRSVILVTRGNDAAAGKAEDPGALKVFDFRDGVLGNKASIAPAGGYGFGPRHIDFHPTKPWVYVSLERENQLQLFRLDGDSLEPEPVFTKNCLAHPDDVHPRQLGGTVHVHPNGRFVYVANRADHQVMHEGKEVFGGGENSIAVFAIDQSTGEPTLIQHVDPQSIHVRTFALDPSARIMVTAAIKGTAVREGNRLKDVPAALSVLRVGDDGRLTFLRKYDVDTGGRYQFWMGIVALPRE